MEDSEVALRKWFKDLSSADWGNFAELRATFSTADGVGQFVVFDIGGNKYRLIVFVDYESGKVFVRHILTHAEYDEDHWKRDPWFAQKKRRRKDGRRGDQ